MEVIDSTVFRAIREALTEEEVNVLYDNVKDNNISQQAKDVIQKVADFVAGYNNDVLKFNIDLDQTSLVEFTGNEGTVMQTLVPDHTVHTGNILKEDIHKISVIINVSSRDDVQGGELTFKHWAPPPRIDNFGSLIVEGAEHQPNWTNEQGTVIMYPSMEQVGYQLITSGPVKRIKIMFKGERFK